VVALREPGSPVIFCASLILFLLVLTDAVPRVSAHDHALMELQAEGQFKLKLLQRLFGLKYKMTLGPFDFAEPMRRLVPDWRSSKILGTSCAETSVCGNANPFTRNHFSSTWRV
jgi:hypothetical protein